MPILKVFLNLLREETRINIELLHVAKKRRRHTYIIGDAVMLRRATTRRSDAPQARFSAAVLSGVVRARRARSAEAPAARGALKPARTIRNGDRTDKATPRH